MRPARRLIVAVVCLAALDQLVPDLLRRLERQRYESTQVFRFESSDLFGLGPLVSYLRDHPRGERPRTLFLGNSVMFGFELAAAEAVPARFQERHPDTQVFNGAVNGFELGSNYLVAKAVIDAVDRFYVMRGSDGANPLLASLIPVGPHEPEEFHLQRPNPLEADLQSIAGFWHLYASTYRLQAAMFGTSTRQYLHLLSRPAITRTFASQGGSVELARPRSATAPDRDRRAELERRDRLLWRFAELVSIRGRRAVFLQIGTPAGAFDDVEIADFNAAFAPRVEIVTLRIPPALLYDTRHLTTEGARKVAEVLP